MRCSFIIKIVHPHWIFLQRKFLFCSNAANLERHQTRNETRKNYYNYTSRQLNRQLKPFTRKRGTKDHLIPLCQELVQFPCSIYAVLLLTLNSLWLHALTKKLGACCKCDFFLQTHYHSSLSKQLCALLQDSIRERTNFNGAWFPLSAFDINARKGKEERREASKGHPRLAAVKYASILNTITSQLNTERAFP